MKTIINKLSFLTSFAITFLITSNATTYNANITGSGELYSTTSSIVIALCIAILTLILVDKYSLTNK